MILRVELEDLYTETHPKPFAFFILRQVLTILSGLGFDLAVLSLSFPVCWGYRRATEPSRRVIVSDPGVGRDPVSYR